ncbi:LLM class F420-dependent oxidoreductase [Microbacterium sp. NPDC076911]|uniref:LLM class F420-dependent oxidoreductase n=1 Tax=Microbacterium sp. NPDC076911 TaxID=3154958 RepID=UPI003440CB61
MEYCLFTEPQQGATYDDQLAFAQAGERTGFTGFFRSDHYLRMGEGDPFPGPTDAWTTLAGIARETSTIRIGTLVSSVTYRVPGILAIQVAQIDAMSGGRAELGLGTGWFEQEHLAYGIPFPSKRFDLLEEQLELINGLWATPADEKYSFDGANYQLKDAPALPRTVQERIPVIVGGSGPRRTPNLAARFATEFNMGFQTESVIAEKFENVRKACQGVGRDPESLKLSVALPTLAAASEAELERRATNIGTTLAEFRGETNITGGAEQIIEKVGRLVDLGAQRIYFQLLDMRDIEQVEFLGAEVLPHLPR